MQEGLEAARALLPGARLERVAELGGNERTVVDRVRARYPDGAEASLIVKQYRSAGEGWVRESAALAVLPPDVLAPRVVAAGSTPPVLILEDVGSGPSVAEALLGADPQTAEHALAAWATAIARLHAGTHSLRESFRAALATRQGELPVHESQLPVDVEEAARALDRACVQLDVRQPDGAVEELRGLGKRLGGSGLAAITPADACPDNNVLTEQGLVLVDFEGAQWRHLAWDVAYLAVPWPTCWCSWRMPDEVIGRAVATYVRAAAPAIPEVARDGFAHDVEAAVVGWSLISTTWFLDNALGSDPPLNPDHPTPTRRAMIMHRLGRAAASGEQPALAELAARLARALQSRWPDAALALAPAFRGGQ